MPNTVQDFMERFGGSRTVDDRDAEQYFDRFASKQEQDRDFDNDTMYEGATEYLGRLPDDQIRRVAMDSYQQAPPAQRQGLIGTLLGALQGRGVNPNTLGNTIGIGSMDPQRMSSDEYARLLNYARREHPDAIRETVRQQPTFLKALGNPIVQGALAVVAAKMMSKQFGRR